MLRQALFIRAPVRVLLKFPPIEEPGDTDNTQKTKKAWAERSRHVHNLGNTRARLYPMYQRRTRDKRTHSPTMAGFDSSLVTARSVIVAVTIVCILGLTPREDGVVCNQGSMEVSRSQVEVLY